MGATQVCYLADIKNSVVYLIRTRDVLGNKSWN